MGSGHIYNKKTSNRLIPVRDVADLRTLGVIQIINQYANDCDLILKLSYKALVLKRRLDGPHKHQFIAGQHS